MSAAFQCDNPRCGAVIKMGELAHSATVRHPPRPDGQGLDACSAACLVVAVAHALGLPESSWWQLPNDRPVTNAPPPLAPLTNAQVAALDRDARLQPPPGAPVLTPEQAATLKPYVKPPGTRDTEYAG